jgi:excisionase family DNA binding protein
MPVQWLTVADAAKFLNISPDFVRKLDQRGQLQSQRTLGGQRLFAFEVVEAFARRRVEKARVRGAPNFGRPRRKRVAVS